MIADHPAPFTYPPTDQPRRHGPDGYTDYRSFRPWIRDDCTFRCVYCLVRERWGRLTGQFDLDHFTPQIQIPGQRPVYDNVVYACHACNLRKHDQQLPIKTLTTAHVRVYADGRLVGLTSEADRLIRLMWLNTPQSIEWRRLWIRIVQLAKKDDEELFYHIMAYPDDLPDLSALDPPVNTKPDGVERSCFARRQRGELPEAYLF